MTVYAFTGTRQGMTSQQKEMLGYLLADAELLHNGAARGADAEAALIASTMGIPIVAHPALGVNPRDRVVITASEWCPPKHPLVRNRIMVDQAEQVIAAPSGFNEQKRGSGTWATIRYARSSHKDLVIIWPHGLLDAYPG